MALEWPDFEAEQKKKEKARRKSGNTSDAFVVSDSDDDDWKPTKKSRKDRGLLFQVDVRFSAFLSDSLLTLHRWQFYRIILDEGHNIRNKRNSKPFATPTFINPNRYCRNVPRSHRPESEISLGSYGVRLLWHPDKQCY